MQITLLTREIKMELIDNTANINYWKCLISGVLYIVSRYARLNAAIEKNWQKVSIIPCTVF
jgi:hypothetical protein